MPYRSTPSPSCPRDGLDDLLQQTGKWNFDSILDIGTGSGYAARYFASLGKTVVATGYHPRNYLSEPLPERIKVITDMDICKMAAFPDESFDAVWCSHVIEHVQNVGLALAEIRRVLRPNGRLFLIVPEYAPILVGGHVSTGWTVGTLMYNLILAGFEVRHGEFINHCWHVSGFVARGELPDVNLNFDKGDIEMLANYFPPEVNVHQRMNACLLKVQWQWHTPICERADKAFRQARFHRTLSNWIPPVLTEALRRLKNLPHTTKSIE